MLCFSYGSNMLKSRLSDRLGPFKRLGAAYLTGYTLRFNKKSTASNRMVQANAMCPTPAIRTIGCGARSIA